MKMLRKGYQLLVQLSVGLLMFTIGRALFWGFNADFFEGADWKIIFYGIRFDISAISWLFLPFILVSLISWWIKWNWSTVLRILFHISNTIAIALNMIDVEFYPFTFRRSTFELFEFLQGESNTIGLVGQYALDFWHLFVIAGIMFYSSDKLYQLVTTRIKTAAPRNLIEYGTTGATTLVMLSLWILGIRGGTQLVPISLVDAGNVVSAKYTPLVLNTPFTMLKTIESGHLEELHYLPKDELQSQWTFNHAPNPNGKYKGQNVVVLILESFSFEYIGHYHPKRKDSYTPVLDSILLNGLDFSHFFANGKRSIDGIPAVLSGLPPLMNTPYITSTYASNRISSIADKLKETGYSSSFYHGGANGTMGFESFMSLANFDRYIGMNEYPDKEKDFDGNWGIFDDAFFDFYATELSKEKEPFISSFFSLSSHHPYAIPDRLTGKFKEGPHPIYKAVHYADYSLGKFFEKASEQPWFNNTLFVITADHASYLTDPRYNNSVGVFRIPLVFYHPNDSTLTGTVDLATDQLSVTPTLLNWLGYQNSYFSFGEVIGETAEGYVVTFTNNRYQILTNEYVLIFDGKSVNGVFEYETDVNQENDLQHQQPELTSQLLKKLQAFIQAYNYRMIHNELS
jgi:phosphoglycerol transferase MdoB-like AlkP superfamily enzyme